MVSRLVGGQVIRAHEQMTSTPNNELKVTPKTSSRDKAREAYPDLARGLGRRETFDDLPASAQNAYEKFVNNIIALHRGEE